MGQYVWTVKAYFLGEKNPPKTRKKYFKMLAAEIFTKHAKH